jgi:MFS family permease
VGLSLGVVLGGLLISAGGNYRSLFVIDGLSCLLLLAVVHFGLTEPRKEATGKSAWEGWETAIKDWRLQVYVCFNLLFTSFVMQVETTLPLFFKNFIHYQAAKGFPSAFITGLFTEYIILMALIQMPTAKRLGSARRTKVLIAAAALMCAGFSSIWLAAICQNSITVLAASIVAMALFALSLVLYGPTASALVAEIAPPDARGVYLSINSLCWAAGGAIGAPIGLAALELPDPLDMQLWLALAIGALLALGMVLFLDAKIPVSQVS